MPFILLAFILIPIIEIYILISVGAVIGTLNTVLLVVLTAIVGTILLRSQGLATINEIQRTLQSGGIPAVPIIGGAILLVGGALLLTPGIVTDLIGLACLVPICRHYLARQILKKMDLSVAINQHHASHHSNQANDNFIEGEYKKEDD